MVTHRRQISRVLLLSALAPAGWAAQPSAIAGLRISFVSPDPSRIAISWETAAPAASEVEYGATPALGRRVVTVEPRREHRVEIPSPSTHGPWYYRVRSGDAATGVIRARGWDADSLRVVIVGDLGYAKRDWAAAVDRERPHVLMTAGDNVPQLHGGAPVQPGDASAFLRLIERAPDLFRSTPFLPVLGNHDRELRPRGPKPPAEPVYDIEATAFRRFFVLPGDRWKWTFDVPAFGVRFVGLDLNHTSDFGTTWQTGHDFREGSEQLEWYRKMVGASRQPFLITIYNERHATVRRLANGAWWPLIARSSAAITGFGYFAERAVVDGVPCVNTSVSGKGDRYPDPASAFLASEDNYVLLTFGAGSARLAIRSLEGETLDSVELPRRSQSPARARR